MRADGPPAEKEAPGADIISAVCELLSNDDESGASDLLQRQYPFAPLPNAGRRYTPSQCTRVFIRDGFIDRYSGSKLIFPGALRLLSKRLPADFPFHNNWKTDSCHFAFYELFPTIDHLVPVSRGGADEPDNWICTSMLRNSAKANFTIGELGWELFPPGDLHQWDGLMGWFEAQMRRTSADIEDNYLRRWRKAAWAELGHGPVMPSAVLATP